MSWGEIWRGDAIWFSPDGHNVWCANWDGREKVLKVGDVVSIFHGKVCWSMHQSI